MAYEDMSVEELTDLIAKLGRQIDDLHAQKREIVQIRDAKILLEEAQHRVGAMSETEKQTLIQLLAPQGIESQEEVGTPGSEESTRRRRWPF